MGSVGLPNASQGTVTEGCVDEEQWGLDTLHSFPLRELQPACREIEKEGSGLTLAGVSGSSQEGIFLRSGL